MKRVLLTIALLVLPALARAQSPGEYKPALVRFEASNPTVACTPGKFWWNTSTNVLWACESGTWVSTLAAASTSFPLLAPNGNFSAPSYSFTNATNAGMFYDPALASVIVRAPDAASSGARVQLGTLSAAQNARLIVGSPGFFTMAGFEAIPGAARVYVGDIVMLSVSSTQIAPTPPIRASNGGVTAPSYSFSSESDLGCYRDGADAMHCNTGSGTTNVGQMQIESGQVALRWRNGSAQNYGFIADSSATTLYYAGVEAVIANSGGTLLRNTTQTILDLNASGPDFVDPGTKPTCDSSKRGIVFVDEGGAGVADTAEMCTKDAGDAYAWRTLIP